MPSLQPDLGETLFLHVENSQPPPHKLKNTKNREETTVNQGSEGFTAKLKYGNYQKPIINDTFQNILVTFKYLHCSNWFVETLKTQMTRASNIEVHSES